MNRKINNASLANLKHFEGKWQHGQTRTIRVPIVLADRILALARRLDKGESLDTGGDIVKELYGRIGELTAKCQSLQQELKKAHNSLDTAEDEISELKSEIRRAKADLKRQQSSGNSTTESNDTSELDAADLLNRLKAKNEKSKATLSDVEAILEILEE